MKSRRHIRVVLRAEPAVLNLLYQSVTSAGLGLLPHIILMMYLIRLNSLIITQAYCTTLINFLQYTQTSKVIREIIWGFYKRVELFDSRLPCDLRTAATDLCHRTDSFNFCELCLSPDTRFPEHLVRSLCIVGRGCWWAKSAASRVTASLHFRSNSNNNAPK